ncbi:MAG: carbamate kinase [Candidatus Saganbacteria bacterium]|nr:carbamate kinase [Candidatus Saganbacteria bacterium]
MSKKILIALGGNALLQTSEKGTAEEQLAHVHETCKHLIEIINQGYSISVTHGNGPQVGDILLKNELALDRFPPMPLDICGAESQGMIGYMIERSLDNSLKGAGLKIPVITILTQTLVSRNDPAFKNPSKPIGPYYTQAKAQAQEKEHGWVMKEETGKGFRRVVPSPQPIALIEAPAIKELSDEKMIVIAAGGGGIPVIQAADGTLLGVEAVIDKDHTAALFAKDIGAQVLLILTDVEQVALNFKKPDQKNLNTLSVSDAKKYIARGEFGSGSMLPKVESAVSFIEGGGQKAIITSLSQATNALNDKAGTRLVRS